MGEREREEACGGEGVRGGVWGRGSERRRVGEREREEACGGEGERGGVWGRGREGGYLPVER